MRARAAGWVRGVLVAGLLSLSAVGGAQALAVPILPPVSPPTIVWDAVVVVGGGVLALVFQEEVTAALEWVGSSLVDMIFTPSQTCQTCDTAAVPDHVIVPDLNVTEADGLPAPPVTYGELRVFEQRSSYEWHEGTPDVFRTVYLSTHPGRLGPFEDGMTAAAEMPVGDGIVYDDLPTGLTDLFRFALTSSGQLFGQFLAQYAQPSSGMPGDRVVMPSAYTQWFLALAYDGPTMSEAFTRQGFGPQDTVYEDDWRLMPMMRLGRTYSVPGLSDVWLPAFITGWQSIEVCCDDGDPYMVSAPEFTEVWLVPQRLEAEIEGNVGWGRLWMDVLEVVLVDLVPVGQFEMQQEGVEYQGAAQSVGVLIGAHASIPWVWDDPDLAGSLEWYGMHTSPDVREAVLWFQALAHWTRARVYPNVAYPDVSYEVTIEAGALPWNEEGALDFGTAVQEGTGLDVWWLVDPVTALETVFVPSVSVSARVEGLLDTLMNRFPFSLASAISWGSAVSDGPLAVPSVEFGGLTIQADNAWLNSLGAVVRLAATALAVTLLVVWIRGKVMPRTVI